MHLVFVIQTTQWVNQSINQLLENYTALDQQSITTRPTERKKENFFCFFKQEPLPSSGASHFHVF